MRKCWHQTPNHSVARRRSNFFGNVPTQFEESTSNIGVLPIGGFHTQDFHGSGTLQFSCDIFAQVVSIFSHIKCYLKQIRFKYETVRLLYQFIHSVLPVANYAWSRAVFLFFYFSEIIYKMSEEILFRKIFKLKNTERQFKKQWIIKIGRQRTIRICLY